MADVGAIKGLESLNRKLRERLAKARKEGNASVVVGYTASYAMWVHEAIEMKLYGLPRGGGRVKSGKRKGQPKRGYFWDPLGKAQAKFLEEPARTLRPELASIVARVVANGMTLTQGLLMAGLRLQRESQEMVPVDTGNLKASAFTRIE